jgi:hypothetical protein
MFLKRASQPFVLGFFAAVSLALPTVAQTSGQKFESLSQPSVPVAVEQVAGENLFWKEKGIAGDAKWVFGFDYGEAKLVRQGERFESLYKDLLKQQTDDHSIIRTQDIFTPFDTSLLEMGKAQTNK